MLSNLSPSVVTAEGDDGDLADELAGIADRLYTVARTLRLRARKRAHRKPSEAPADMGA